MLEGSEEFKIKKETHSRVEKIIKTFCSIPVLCLQAGKTSDLNEIIKVQRRRVNCLRSRSR